MTNAKWLTRKRSLEHVVHQHQALYVYGWEIETGCTAELTILNSALSVEA